VGRSLNGGSSRNRASDGRKESESFLSNSSVLTGGDLLFPWVTWDHRRPSFASLSQSSRKKKTGEGCGGDPAGYLDEESISVKRSFWRKSKSFGSDDKSKGRKDVASVSRVACVKGADRPRREWGDRHARRRST